MANDQGHATAQDPNARRLKFPTALTVLAIVLLSVWVASFFIPSGVYEFDETGPIPGTYSELPSCGDAAEGELCVDKGFFDQFSKLWDAPPSGLYGIENSEGFVGADEEGFLYGSAAIFLFVLAIGAFVGGLLIVLLALSGAALLRRDWWPERLRYAADLLAAPAYGVVTFVLLLPVVGILGLVLTLLTGETVEDNDAYRFISDSAQGATRKYGVKSVSVLAVKK